MGGWACLWLSAYPLGSADRPACRWQAQRCIPKLPCLRKGASQIEVPAPAPVPGLGKRGGCGKRCRVGLASVIGQGWLGKRCRGSLLLPCFAALAGWLLCLEALASKALPVPSLGGLPVGCP